MEGRYLLAIGGGVAAALVGLAVALCCLVFRARRAAVQWRCSRCLLLARLFQKRVGN